MAIREPGLVGYLVDVFERAWERARPFTNTRALDDERHRPEQRAMTIRMLIEGHSDPVSAKRLGVSARTFAGYVADLKAEYDAETRFQLGYTMGQRRRRRRARLRREPRAAPRTDENGTGPEGPVPPQVTRERPAGGTGGRPPGWWADRVPVWIALRVVRGQRWPSRWCTVRQVGQLQLVSAWAGARDAEQPEAHHRR